MGKVNQLLSSFRPAGSWRQVMWEYLQITLGCVIMGISYNLFYVPNSIVAGGVSGIGIILKHFFGWPPGIVILTLNIPLFLAGLRWGGGIPTGLRTIYAVAVMSLTIDLAAPYLPELTNSPLLYVAYGGLLDGLGMGLVFRAQGTTGGTDIIGRLLNHFAGIEVSRGVFLANAVVTLAAALAFGIERALYGIMVAAISSWGIDLVLAGGRQARQAFIISEKWEEIRDVLLSDLHRGVTVVEGEGAYTGENRAVLMCIITPTEVGRMKRLIEAIDRRAFVVITAATEVWGEGFGDIKRQV
jgi:uncharacterized membrane-anchored protein YitT (DUF2179 family)